MPADHQGSQKAAPRPPLFWVLYAAAFAVVAGLIWAGFRYTHPPEAEGATQAPVARQAVSKEDQALYATYGGSPSCKDCHEEAYKLWENSHHGLAERMMDPVLEAAAFQSHFNKIRHGSQVSSVTNNNGTYEIHTLGLSGRIERFVPKRVLGVNPLRQFIVPKERGIFQVTELAFDPNHPDWFNVYGNEDRRPGEWGAWTGRGMTWNTMCAACHNTRLRKNYNPADDSYRTAMVERGVGCESCHGPMADHNAWQAAHPKQEGDPTIKKLSREQMFNVCSTCHSRRAELTGDFKPGDSYFDHHSLTIPDETDLFYPDGQIRDEDFELTAFLGSRMHASGVRCIDCHEPHAGKVRISGNYLCLVCHAAENPPAPKIDINTHSHHKIGERGDSCVGCHMPQTVYMQRHSRHDHGFSVPDPLLTKEFGIPNACNRCHDDRDVDWSLEYVQKWYGDRMNRPTRARAQMMAKAKQGAPGSAAALTAHLDVETNSLWRAVSVGFLRRWATEPKVTTALLNTAKDPHSMVRSQTLRSLENLLQGGDPRVRAVFEEALGDTNRNVRLDAAWGLHAVVDTNSVAGKDLLRFLHHTSDQPSGALQTGIFRMDRGDLLGAMSSFQRALLWDTNSAPIYNALAVGYSMQNKGAEAVLALERACELAPTDAEYRFKLGLAYSEAGRLRDARSALREAVRIDPDFATAWYNLGLAENANGDVEPALEALLRGETADPQAAQIPYARATILARLGRNAEAAAAAQRALEIRPNYPEAQSLLGMLSSR